MSWQDFSVGRKIGIGFGLVLVILGVVAVWSTLGIGGIVGNASEVIDGNKLRGVMVEKEVDHLNWANQVSALLTDDNVTELHVETDDHKCAFGKWLYGEEREQAETLVPELKGLLKEVEAPHHKLHASAIEIGRHHYWELMIESCWLCYRSKTLVVLKTSISLMVSRRKYCLVWQVSATWE